VENFFQVQVRLARELELRLTDQWAQHGFQFSGAIPDLATQIRPQLDEVTTQMLRALYLAAPALRQPGFIDRYTEVAHRHLQGDGWSQDSRRELLATLAVVRQKAAPALQRVAAAGVLRVGLTGDYAPFSLEVQGAVSGADVELARELADDLHAKPVFIRTSWKSLLDDLGHDDFDLVMGGVSITPERRGRAEFSVAYASGGKTIIARCADKARYAGLASVDRSSVRVIVNPGGTNEQFVRANLRNARIRVYPDNRTIFDEIRSGRADVMITDDTEVDLQTQRHADLCRAFAGTLTHADKAILMQRDPPLVAAVNTWLSAQIAAGKPAQLLQRAISN
jgi:cyclohexadienyl dehydratase